jgi:hypothetical protein
MYKDQYTAYRYIVVSLESREIRVQVIEENIRRARIVKSVIRTPQPYKLSDEFWK